jgi:hypothetical protein
MHSNSIDKILVFCNKEYMQKSNDLLGGVGNETRILMPFMFEENGHIQSRVIPIITEFDGESACVPDYLKGIKYINLANSDTFQKEFDKLIRAIYDKPKLKRPALGPIPIFEDSSFEDKTIHHYHLIKQQFNTSTNEYRLNEALNNIYNTWSEHRIFNYDDTTWVDTFDKEISFLKKYRDVFIDIVEMSIESIEDDKFYKLFFKFFEKCISFHYCPNQITDSFYTITFEPMEFIVWESFLYFIAILIQNEKYEMVVKFTEDIYYNDNIKFNNNKCKWDFSIFSPHNDTLEASKRIKYNLNFKSVTAKTFQDRLHEHFNFNELLQVEFILLLKFVFNENQQDYLLWKPILLLHSESVYNLAMFSKAEYKKYFWPIKILFHVDDAIILKKKWEDAVQNYYLNNLANTHSIRFRALLNIDNLNTLNS